MAVSMEHWEVLERGQVAVPMDAEELWEAAVSYFKHCRDNPIETKKAVNVGKEAGKDIKLTHTRPFNLKALCLHCGVSTKYFADIKEKGDVTDEYYIVVERIEYIIHAQLAEHAILGIYNPVVTSKMMQLDKVEEPTGNILIEIVQGLPELATSENDIINNIENENRSSENPREQS